MPLVRVVTTAQCSPNLRVGDHEYQPDRTVEQEMTDDGLDLLRSLARDGGPLHPMFSAISVGGQLPEQPAPAVPAAPEPPRSTRTAKTRSEG